MTKIEDISKEFMRKQREKYKKENKKLKEELEILKRPKYKIWDENDNDYPEWVAKTTDEIWDYLFDTKESNCSFDETKSWEWNIEEYGLTYEEISYDD